MGRNLVIITGASSGLGLAVARSVPFAARIVDISRTGPPPDSDIEHWEADLSDPESWQVIADRLTVAVNEEPPQRAVMIHAAGTLAPMGYAGEVESRSYRQNVVLNSASGQILGDAFLEAVHGREGSHDLVMISSGAATTPYRGWSAYCAGKAALEQWVRVVGEEQKDRGGVRVSAVAPGVLDTSMQQMIRGQSDTDFPEVERFRQLHENDDLVSPESAAQKLWELIEGGIEPGSILDLRDV